MRLRFTLVEVLIIVVVLALLAGLLPAVLNAKREQKRRTHCAGNLKQIGLTLLMYSGDNGGWFPSRDADFSVVVDQNYIANEPVWRCPSARIPEQAWATYTGPVRGGPPGQLVTHRYLPIRSSPYRYVGSGLRDDVPEAKSVSLAFDQSNNHPRNRWMNVLFADGHVEGAPPGSTPHYQNGPPQ